MQLQIIAVLYGRERKLRMDAHPVIAAIEFYDPDRALWKIHVDDKDPSFIKYRPFAVMPFRLRNGKKDLSVGIMDKAELSPLYNK